MNSARKIQCGLGLVFLVAVHGARGRCTNYLQFALEFHLGLYGRHEGEP